MLSEKYGLAALTPMYGQVIMSAPTWSGPFVPPQLPPPIQVPPQKSQNSFWAGLGAEFGVGVGCAVLAPSMVGMLACPLLGQTAGAITRNAIN
jgi:hypothetical protein